MSEERMKVCIAIMACLTICFLGIIRMINVTTRAEAGLVWCQIKSQAVYTWAKPADCYSK